MHRQGHRRDDADPAHRRGARRRLVADLQRRVRPLSATGSSTQHSVHFPDLRGPTRCVIATLRASIERMTHPLERNAAGGPMQIALALYPNFTMLDIVGPFQVLADVPGHDVTFVAAEAGPVVDHTGRATLIASKSFADVPAPDIIVVPGGLNDTELQPALVNWLRAVHPTTTWTTSVCTGAVYLAAAGILDGLHATPHW